MEDQKTHWRKLHNPDYFGSYVFEQGQTEMTVKILSVQKEVIKTAEGSEEHTVATLENQKPWILNVTNQKAITKLLDTPYVEEWNGREINLYPKMIRAFGENVEAVRVRPTLPAKKTKQELTPESPKWANAIGGLKGGGLTMEQLAEFYEISAENLKKLNDETSKV